MPTTNRSSSTDPRDLFISLNPLGLDEKDLRKDSTGFEDSRTHGDYLLFLAGYRESHPEHQHQHQHQAEAIAWMVGTAIWWTKEEAERDAAATGLPIVGLGPMTGIAPAQQQQGEPVAIVTIGANDKEVIEFLSHDLKVGTELYTHADPGEVERLVAANTEYARRHLEQAGEIERLRSELNQCVAMAAMIAEREWAEHAGTGTVSSKVEAAFTQLHNELHEAGEKLAERDALLQRMKTLFRTDDPLDLYDAVCNALACKS